MVVSSYTQTVLDSIKNGFVDDDLGEIENAAKQRSVLVHGSIGTQVIAAIMPTTVNAWGIPYTNIFPGQHFVVAKKGATRSSMWDNVVVKANGYHNPRKTSGSFTIVWTGRVWARKNKGSLTKGSRVSIAYDALSQELASGGAFNPCPNCLCPIPPYLNRCVDCRHRHDGAPTPQVDPEIERIIKEEEEAERRLRVAQEAREKAALADANKPPPRRRIQRRGM